MGCSDAYLAIYDGQGGAHAITVWGYEYDDQGNYLGIYLTDSDDDKNSDNPPDTLDYYSITTGVYDLWFIEDFGGINDYDWYIGSVQALDQKPVPEPAAMLLLASGLIGLAGFRRKFRKP